MKLSRKTIIGIVAVGAVAYYVWDRSRKGKSLNPFSSFSANEEEFLASLNAGGEEAPYTTKSGTSQGSTFYQPTAGGVRTLKGCKTYKGNVRQDYIGTVVDNGRVIVSTGNGYTTVCPQRY